MIETREFPTAVIASLSSGTLLCEFSAMHEAAEFLMGHPIWTHHFANKDLWEAMKRSIAEQCPGMPMEEIDGVTRDNYREKVRALEAELGPIQRIRKGCGVTAMLPTDGIPEHVETIVVSL